MTHILLADDDRLVLATTARNLRDAGFAVTAVSSGEEALDLARKGGFDLALLDIRMGRVSGTETARHLKDAHDLPVMFLTAYGEQGLVEDAIAKGGLAYVMKPVDTSQLIPAIATALARARDLRALAEARSQLEQALAAGRETSVAVGIVMERCGLGQKAAFELLRANARQEQRKLNEYCQELVAAEERLNGLAAQAVAIGTKPRRAR